MGLPSSVTLQLVKSNLNSGDSRLTIGTGGGRRQIACGEELLSPAAIPRHNMTQPRSADCQAMQEAR